MPFVSVTLAEGRTPETLRRLISEITDAVVRSGAAPKENVRVVLIEVPSTHFAAADVTLAERHSHAAGAASATAEGEEPIP
jgi:4-oxalocrotonate tautomerase